MLVVAPSRLASCPSLNRARAGRVERAMRSISIEALVAWLESGDPPRLVDVLSAEHYAEIHLPGAENIPRQELAVRAANELARDEPVVVYCAGPTSRESERAVAVLEELGYDDVVRFEGGLVEWRQRGLPVVRPGTAW